MSVMPLALLAFFAFGFVLVLPGALQPALASKLSLGLAQSGLVASALMLGILAGSLASAPLVDRLPRRPLFAVGVGGCALALLGVGSAVSFAALLGAAFALGVASGAYETLLNAAVPESQPERAAPRLALAHAAATLGAALGAPLLASLAGALGVLGAACALTLPFVGLALAAKGAGFPAPPGTRCEGMPPARLPARSLAPLALAAAAYVGVETAISVLLPPLARAAGLATGRGALAISAFWGGVFFARLAFARLALPARRRELVLGSGLAACALLGLAWEGGRALEVWSAAVGFALGAVFPVLVVLAGDAAPQRRASALALVVSAGSLGGGALPWLAGQAGVHAAPLVLAGGCAVIALGAACARRG
jgi:fucose permease